MIRCFGMVAVLVLLALPAVQAQTQNRPGATQGAAGQGGATGQQNSQPSANLNQSQMQTNDSQQPPQVKVLPPTAGAQAQPDPKPELSR